MLRFFVLCGLCMIVLAGEQQGPPPPPGGRPGRGGSPESMLHRIARQVPQPMPEIGHMANQMMDIAKDGINTMSDMAQKIPGAMMPPQMQPGRKRRNV